MVNWNSEPLGNMTLDKDDGRVQFVFGQMNNISTKELREVKLQALKCIEKKYNTQIGVFNEIDANFDNARRGVNFQQWMGDHGKRKCVMAYNTNDKDIKCFHQPGGTGIRVTGSMTQYCRKTTKDSRGLGRFCSAVYYANTCQKFWIISMYNICKGKPEGL